MKSSRTTAIGSGSLANSHALTSPGVTNVKEEIPHLEHDVEQTYFTANRISDTIDSIAMRLRHGNADKLAQETSGVTGMLNQAATALQQLNDIETKLENLKHILFGSN